MEHLNFVDRVMQRLPSGGPKDYDFFSWSHGGRPTREGFGIMRIPGVDPGKVIDAVMDVDHYVGNVGHVDECRTIEDERFDGREHVRFFQRVNIPLLGKIQQELVLHRLEARDGYQLAAWSLLEKETNALDPRNGFRTDYSVGGWIVAKDVIGYALCTAPKRKDVGFLKFKAMTKGADVAAKQVIQANLKIMAKWAGKR
jgi:hypothetical protein